MQESKMDPSASGSSVRSLSRSDTRVITEEDLQNRKAVYLFGRDLTEIPCFRKSFLYGICGGVIAGLGCFLVTSKTLFSTHVAFGSLWVCVFGYWIPCRYKYDSFVKKLEAVKAINAKEKNKEEEKNKNKDLK